ncbi:hypothetical protein Hypma_006599 [Hypsizygus marmoreus]|uniref:Uncharacterized protein n=1 Tax=Hypsizygus marmoreus TaxID=39966 RepID=A0A369JWY2_HYPMA|nr:hypothetical protein Hypma_006599 [Hypsizygus marmoreus]
MPAVQLRGMVYLPSHFLSSPSPSCQLEGEPELWYRRMWVMDGNNSLKRIRGIGDRQVADTRIFEASDYFLPSEFVNRFANEVKAPPKPAAGAADEDIGPSEETEADGDPTDGDPFASPSGCTDNWKAAASDEKKKMWAIFDESGIFASACRHGFVMWITDMVRSGELAKYPLAMVAKALEVLGPQHLVGYDIGCQFQSTISTSSLGPKFTEEKCRCCLNAFHGFTHNYLCQLHHHPNCIDGMGIEDLETLERVFSLSNALAPITRYMTAYRRRVFIDLYF